MLKKDELKPYEPYIIPILYIKALIIPYINRYTHEIIMKS